jgi:Electron transfer DM13
MPVRETDQVDMQIAATLRGTIRRHPGRWTVAAVVAAALIAFAVYWFAPWNLFLDQRVDESLPTAAGAGVGDERDAPGTEDDAVGDEAGGEAAGGSEAEPLVLTRGEFRSLEHATSGVALVLELEDGSRFLRLEGLETSNGPDLRLIITDRPVSDDWRVWDDGEYVDLGALKGNIGSSNYEIPRGTDLSRFRTAVVWCRRFSVGFGVAPLAR